MRDQDGRVVKFIALSYLWQVPVGAAVLMTGVLLLGPFPASLLLAAAIGALMVLTLQRRRRQLRMSRRRPSG